MKWNPKFFKKFDLNISHFSNSKIDPHVYILDDFLWEYKKCNEIFTEYEYDDIVTKDIDHV